MGNERREKKWVQCHFSSPELINEDLGMSSDRFVIAGSSSSSTAVVAPCSSKSDLRADAAILAQDQLEWTVSPMVGKRLRAIEPETSQDASRAGFDLHVDYVILAQLKRAMELVNRADCSEVEKQLD